MISDPDVIQRLRNDPRSLNAWDKIRLFGTGPDAGGLGFRKGSAPAEHCTRGRSYHVKGGRPRGTVRKVAFAMIAGEYPGLSTGDVAALNKIDDQSLKNTVWRIKNAWKEKPRKKQRRKIAA